MSAGTPWPGRPRSARTRPTPFPHPAGLEAPMDIATQSWLLAELGEDTDLNDLAARLARLGRPRAVAIEVLRGRRAKLLASPAVLGISSVLNVSYVRNIDALDTQIAALESGNPPAPGEPGYGCDPEPDDGLDLIQIRGRNRR